MPLAVALRDARGALLDHLVRAADGTLVRDEPAHAADELA